MLEAHSKFVILIIYTEMFSFIALLKKRINYKVKSESEVAFEELMGLN